MSDEKPVVASAIVPAPVPAAKSAAASVTVGRQGVMLQSLDDLMRFAKMCVEGGTAPKGMNQAQAALAIQAGMERGLGPLGGLQAAVVINGVLSWRGWAAVGLIQNSGVCVPGTFQSWVEGDGDKAVGYCRAQRKGYEQPFIRKFSVEDAKKAKLWNKDGPWLIRPTNMLEWRAIGDMARFHFGDVLGGIPIAEDVEAGGIGEVGPRELPAERVPHPPAVVRDPILEKFGVGALPAPPAPPTEAAPAPPPGVEPEPAQPEPVMAQSSRSPGRVTDDAGQEPELEGARVTKVVRGVRMKAAEPVAMKPRPCERCESALNDLGGCDVCGWPGEDIR